jgi:predicted RNase H-like HicB family nuclease
MKNAYLTNIWWSDEDKCFIANAPALDGCMTFGDTRAEAAGHIDEAIEAWLESAERAGDPVPEPDTRMKNARNPKAVIDAQ